MNHEDMYSKSNQFQNGANGTFSRPPHCANCDIEILWPPTVLHGQTYCCTGCAAGGPCCCDYSLYCSVTISGVIVYGSDEETLRKSADLEAS